MFIVSGATGNTGSIVAKTLLEKSLPVRVIVRSREKGAVFEKLGAEIAVADLQNADALTEALRGGKVLYLMNPPAYQAADQFAELEKNIESFQTAIENSALEKIVVLSSIGAHLSSGTGNILTAYRLEQAFGNLNIPVTFVRAGSFMENWNAVLDAAKTQGVLPSFYQPLDRKVPQVAAADIGRVAAFAMQEKTVGVEVKELAGFWTSPAETAEAFGVVLGREVKAVPIPENQWTDILKNHNSSKNAASLAEMFAGYNAGHIKFETENQMAGKITVEDWARAALEIKFMAELKTKETNQSVEDFLDGAADENVRADCRKITGLMENATGAKPKMWGDSIVGFGSRTLNYSTGRELNWLEIGFSPRKQNLTLYLNIGEGWDEDLLSKLGKHKLGKGCLYFKRLSDVDETILEKLIENSVENIRRK